MEELNTDPLGKEGCEIRPGPRNNVQETCEDGEEKEHTWETGKQQSER